MKKIVICIAIVLIIILAVFVLTRPRDKGIVGKWEYSSYVYTFNSNKTGVYDAAGAKMNFTYEDDGEKLSILFEGNTSPMVLNYKIDGNKLIITDSFGSDVEYIKK